jgi:hypothetical protein
MFVASALYGILLFAKEAGTRAEVLLQRMGITMRFPLLQVAAFLVFAVGVGCERSVPDNSRPQEETQNSASDARDIAKVTPEQKKAFLELLQRLPGEGEFFTKEGVQRASPFVHVLLALDENDINENYYFPLFALSRGLHDAKKEHREFAIKNFGQIRHPAIKTFWGLVLFRFSGEVSPEVTRYLRESLDNREQSQLISQILGPEFEAVRKQIIAKAEHRGQPNEKARE